MIQRETRGGKAGDFKVLRLQHDARKVDRVLIVMYKGVKFVIRQERCTRGTQECENNK